MVDFMGGGLYYVLYKVLHELVETTIGTVELDCMASQCALEFFWSSSQSSNLGECVANSEMINDKTDCFYTSHTYCDTGAENCSWAE
jgi:hypothetical protein